MPLVTMRPILKQAQAGHYGVAAYNMIDYNSARSIIDGAAELNAPVIVQVSVKTIKHWGFKPIASWVRMLAGGPACRSLQRHQCHQGLHRRGLDLGDVRRVGVAVQGEPRQIA
jgi:fructose/tagatose bisphosphate aldolase